MGGCILVCVCICVCVCLCVCICICEYVCVSYRKSSAYILLIIVLVYTYSPVLLMSVSKCHRVCLLSVCGPPSSAKVIHHSTHQMTSPPTPILQLLPFHPPHILHSDGLALCHHPPSSSSSSFRRVLHLTQLCCCSKSAESSLATIYKADMGQA